jgi:hypothetical protein
VTKCHLITFRNKGYSQPDRFLSQAIDSGFFSTITCYTNSDIRPLLFRHPLHFYFRRNQGFGSFIWKPYLLLRKLSHVNDGDVVVYSDLGNHISKSGHLMFSRYMDTLIHSNKSIGVFDVGEYYKSASFVYKRAVDSYYPAFYGDWKAIQNSVYGGLVFARKTKNVEKILNDWLRLCKEYLTPLFPDKKSTEIPQFIGQDADNGFLPLILSMHNDYVIFPGGDVNLYSREGIQLKHSLSNKEYESLDWSPLDASPFTLRRDR